MQINEITFERVTQAPAGLIHRGNIPANRKRNTTYMCLQKHLMAYGRKLVIGRTCDAWEFSMHGRSRRNGRVPLCLQYVLIGGKLKNPGQMN